MPPSAPPQETLPRAAEVCRNYQPAAEARKLLSDDIMADAYLARLIDGGLLPDALEFLSYWLPKREAVWWGCLCVWKVARPEPSPKESAALQSAVRWVLEPNEANRRAAEAAANLAGIETPAGCRRLAAFASSGSLSAPELPEAAPPPFLTAKIVFSALRAAAIQDRPDKQPLPQRLFITLGRELVSGQHRWEAVPK